MYEDIYKNLSDSLLYTFSPLIEQQTKLASNALNSISEALQESFYNLATYYNQNIAVDLANQIFALTSVMVSAIEIPSISLLNLKKHKFRNRNTRHRYYKLCLIWSMHWNRFKNL